MSLLPTKHTIDNLYNTFMPLSPVVVNISNSVLWVIQFNPNYIVRIIWSHFVDFTLSSPSFDDLDINWTPSTDSLIENIKISAWKSTARTVMRLTTQNTAVQNYKVGAASSQCFEYQHDQLTFTVDWIAAIIPNDALTSRNFEYRNSQMDTELTSHNSIKFVFTTEYTQIYLYAVLTCLENDFPTDEQMKTGNVTETPQTSYISEILNIQWNTNLVFDNLLRWEYYKLKVYIESTQWDKTLRTSSQLIMTNYTLQNWTVIPITASSPVPTLCASYLFKTRPGIQTKEPLRWYW